MKPIHSILIGLSILILTSCSVSISSGDLDVKRQDILGSWKISKGSLRMINNDTTKKKIITSFRLNADSTVIVSFGGSTKKKMTGTWAWKAEKELGNRNFGISVKSDVAVYVNGLFTLGLQISKMDGEIILSAADYTFEKQE